MIRRNKGLKNGINCIKAKPNFFHFYSALCTFLLVQNNQRTLQGCQETHRQGANKYDGNQIINITNAEEPNTTQQEVQPFSSPFASIVKRREGSTPNSWKVVEWDNSPITPEEEENFTCDFATFTSTASGKSAQICVHSFRDIVSGAIRRKQHWGDCNVLPNLWNDATALTAGASSPVYLEIGANIGSCVMEMLLGTDAPIIAFEPHPMNLYNLKKTILQLDKSYRDRLTLFPIGLGDAEATFTIYSANNNMGNSVIGTIVKDGENQQFAEKLQFKVHVERLDSLLSSQGLDVKLIKIDAQGFECRVLEGMGEDIAKTVEQIKFEYARNHLMGQNCTDYLPRLRKYGYDIFRRKGGAKLAGNPGGALVDLYAAKPSLQ